VNQTKGAVAVALWNVNAMTVCELSVSVSSISIQLSTKYRYQVELAAALVAYQALEVKQHTSLCNYRYTHYYLTTGIEENLLTNIWIVTGYGSALALTLELSGVTCGQ
jgi:hypothetical protein